MKILGHLTGKIINAEWDENRGTIQAAHVEVQPGCFVHVALGAAGVTVFHGKSKIALPMAELLALAQHHDASLKPQAVAEVKAKADAEMARLQQEAKDRKLAARNPETLPALPPPIPQPHI